MTKKTSIHWFRQDLRIIDNPALINASQHKHVMPIYILDDINSMEYAMGRASRVWLHYSLMSLNKSLNGNLSIYQGDPLIILSNLVSQIGIDAVYWNRCYEPWRISRDKIIKVFLEKKGVFVESSNASLLWEPWKIKKKDGTPYRVFTPFYRNGCLQASTPRKPLKKPKKISYFKDENNSLLINQFKLLPKASWDKKITNH